MTPVRIMVADSRAVTRSVLTALISSHFGWQVCGEASDAEDAIEKAAQLNPDIVVLDIDLPQSGGLEVTRRIADRNPDQKCIVLATGDQQAVTRKIFDSGAYGFLLKANATRDLVVAIERVASGRTFYSAKAAELVLQDCLCSPAGEEVLTRRQRAIVELLAKEFSSTFGPSHNRVRRTPRSKLVAVAIAGMLLMAAIYLMGARLVDYPLLSFGLKAASSRASAGNPDARVWIDLRTALYYCPGEPQYARHPNGRFSRQIEAQLDHFEPASRRACK